MSYIIYLINKDTIKITEAEYKAFAGKSGLVYIPSTGHTVNTTSISHIQPEEDYWKGERRKSDHGVLHDGTKVVRQFGQWVCDDGQRDEEGRLVTFPDPSFYPECARDCVPTPLEFEQVIKPLSIEERKKYLLGTGIPEQRLDSGFKRLSDIVK